MSSASLEAGSFKGQRQIENECLALGIEYTVQPMFSGGFHGNYLIFGNGGKKAAYKAVQQLKIANSCSIQNIAQDKYGVPFYG